MSQSSDVDADWQAFMAARGAAELDQIITDENLDADATRQFMDAAFRDGVVPTAGTAITRLIPPMSRFSPEGGRAAKKRAVAEELTAFLDRFYGMG